MALGLISFLVKSSKSRRKRFRRVHAEIGPAGRTEARWRTWPVLNNLTATDIALAVRLAMTKSTDHSFTIALWRPPPPRRLETKFLEAP